MPAVAPCSAAQLRLSVGRGDGDLDGMSHAGVELSVRNLGPDCTLPALPPVAFRDVLGRRISAVRRPPVGMHPGPVMSPVRLGGGHRATAGLRWVSGPVYPDSRSVHATTVTVRAGGSVLRAPLDAVLYGRRGSAFTFDQAPLRAAEGGASG